MLSAAPHLAHSRKPSTSVAMIRGYPRVIRLRQRAPERHPASFRCDDLTERRHLRTH
jgi:hypothetical protein